MKRSTPMKRTRIKPGKKRLGSKPKSAKQKAVKALDVLWSEAIRHRDGPTCPYCGVRPVNQAHHIFSRRIYSTRWEPGNGVGLCQGCHKFTAHQHPERFRRWLVGRMGQEAYDALYHKSELIKTYDMAMSEIVLRAMIKEQEG